MDKTIASPVAAAELAAMMRSARQRTLELLDGLTADQLMGPKLATVNPLLWEVGHATWFHEFFILRSEYGHPPLLERGDALYDSIAIAHDDRWDLPLYGLEEVKSYMAAVQESLFARLGSGTASPRDSYLYQFTTFHEDMHGEAYTWARQTLAYPAPRLEPDGSPSTVEPGGEPGEEPSEEPGGGPWEGDADIPGGTIQLGSPHDGRFVFDNEKWAHDVIVAPFRMAMAPVTNREFLAFVQDGGYGDARFWSEEGWRWRQETAAEHPVYWQSCGSDGWRMRRFDTWLPLPPHEPVVHVNWFEADAWCRWAGRRLPTEAEWEFAARWRPDEAGGLHRVRYPWGDGPIAPGRANLDGFALGCVDVGGHAAGDNAWGVRQLIGNVWEWTADTFGPFSGFSPDDYREYSEPLFGDTKVLRGGAWTTRGRMISSAYRNYFPPDRRDVFAGFRTCAI